jgi:hypothetical protein
MDTPVIVLLVALVILASVGTFLYLRSRPKPEDPIVNFPCPHCKRKLRYRQALAGRRGACPRCKGDFTFPSVPGGSTLA